jgi:hypothetical protein
MHSSSCSADKSGRKHCLYENHGRSLHPDRKRRLLFPSRKLPGKDVKDKHVYRLRARMSTFADGEGNSPAGAVSTLRGRI